MHKEMLVWRIEKRMIVINEKEFVCEAVEWIQLAQLRDL
jgi:hypothetical protein